MRRALGRVAPVRLAHAVVLEHQLRAHPAGCQRHRGAPVGRELLRQRPGHPDDRRLGEVVEHRHPVVVRVVGGGAVGDLDHEPAGTAHQQRQRVVARDQVRVDGEAQQPQAVVEVVLPDRRVPLEQVLGAPDVVHEHVEAALLGVDPLDQRRHLLRLEVVDRHGDALPARLAHELGGLLDRLGAVDLRARSRVLRPGRVHGRARLAERDRDAAPSAARGARAPARPALQRPAHAGTPSIVSRGRCSRARRRPRSRARRRAAGAAEQLAEDEEGEHHRDHRLDGREDRGASSGPRASARRRRGSPRRPSRPPRCRQPAPAGERDLAGVEVAQQRRARRSASRPRRCRRARTAASAAMPPGDALAHEDVGRVDDRRAERERRRRPGRAYRPSRWPAPAPARRTRARAPRSAGPRRAHGRGRSARRRPSKGTCRGAATAARRRCARARRRSSPPERRTRTRRAPSASADVAATQPAGRRRPRRREHQRPEQRGGEDEANGEQRADGGALVVGELAEHRHGAEGGRGADA